MPLPFRQVATRLTTVEARSIIENLVMFQGTFASLGIVYSDTDRFDGLLLRAVFHRGRGDVGFAANLILQDFGFEAWYGGNLVDPGEAHYTPKEAFELIEAAYDADPLGFLTGYVTTTRAKQLLTPFYSETLAETSPSKLMAHCYYTPSIGDNSIYDPGLNTYWLAGTPNQSSRASAFNVARSWYAGTQSAGYVTDASGASPPTTTYARTTIEVGWNAAESPNVVLFTDIQELGERDTDVGVISDNFSGGCRIVRSGGMTFGHVEIGDTVLVEGCSIEAYNRAHVVTAIPVADEAVDTDVPYGFAASGGTARRLGTPQIATNVVNVNNGIYDTDLTFDELASIPVVWQFCYRYNVTHNGTSLDMAQWAVSWINARTNDGMCLNFDDSLAFSQTQGLFLDTDYECVAGGGVWDFDAHTTYLVPFNRYSIDLCAEYFEDNAAAPFACVAFSRRAPGFTNLDNDGAIDTAVEEDTASTKIVGFDVSADLDGLGTDGTLTSSIATRVSTSPAVTIQELKAWLVDAHIKRNFCDFLDAQAASLLQVWPDIRIGGFSVTPRSGVYGPLWQPWGSSADSTNGGNVVAPHGLSGGAGTGFLQFAQVSSSDAWFDPDAVEWYLPPDYDGSAAERRFRSIEGQWLSYQQVMRCTRGDLCVYVFDEDDARHGPLQNHDDLYFSYAQALAASNFPVVVCINAPRVGTDDQRFVDYLREYTEIVPTRNARPVPREPNRSGAFFGSAWTISTVDANGYHYHMVCIDALATTSVAQEGPTVTLSVTSPYTDSIAFPNAELLEPTNRVSSVVYIRESSPFRTVHEIRFPAEPLPIRLQAEPDAITFPAEPNPIKFRE